MQMDFAGHLVNSKNLPSAFQGKNERSERISNSICVSEELSKFLGLLAPC